MIFIIVNHQTATVLMQVLLFLRVLNRVKYFFHLGADPTPPISFFLLMYRALATSQHDKDKREEVISVGRCRMIKLSKKYISQHF